MSKEYYRKQLVTLREQLTKEREMKKKHNADYASRIKNASTASMKASFRRSKISQAATHDRNIESLKKRIASARELMKKAK